MLRALCKRNYSSILQSRNPKRIDIPDLPYSMINRLQTFFQKNGFAIIQNAIPENVIQNLKGEMSVLREKQDAQRLADLSRAPDHFLQSGDKINFFLNSNALNSDKKLEQPLQKSVKSVGHALHQLNRVFQAFTYNDIFKSIAQGIFKMQAPVIVHSKYNFHHPQSPQQEPIADNSFFRTRPLSCCGIQVVLNNSEDPAPIFGIPGSHLQKTQSFMKRSVRKNVEEKQLLGKKQKVFKYEQYTYFAPEEPQYDISNAISLKIPPGSLFLIHGDFVYFNGMNASSTVLESYKFNIVESRKTKWEKDNWYGQIIVGLGEVKLSR